MTGTQKPIVWLVDENKSQLRTCAQLLRKALPDSLELMPIMARPHKEDYLDILANPMTVAVILDQKLKDTGIATYSGTELAKYLRQLNSKLPIYILTNYASEKDEFAGSEWSVEDILAKDGFRDDDRTHMVISRFLRHINVYEDILAAREARVRALLAKSLQGELSTEEIDELEILQFERSTPALASELSQIKEIQQIIEANEELLRKLSSSRQEENS